MDKYTLIYADSPCKLPEWLDASICQHIIAPRMEHSAKPPVIRGKLVNLLGNVPRIELFSRQSAEGWDSWGNECECSIDLLPGITVDLKGER